VRRPAAEAAGEEGAEGDEGELELLEHNKLLEKVSAAVVQEFVCELFFTDMRK
jgi:hypothetical protein